MSKLAAKASQRTFLDATVMSALCQKRTHAAQQKGSLFDQRVGAQQELFRNREVNCLRSLEIDDQLELRGLFYG